MRGDPCSLMRLETHCFRLLKFYYAVTHHESINLPEQSGVVGEVRNSISSLTGDTTLNIAATPLTQKMTWITDYMEADEILRTPSFLQASKMESKELIGDTIITLDGDAHTTYRRRLARLVSRPALAHYDVQIFEPAIRETLERTAKRRGADRLVRTNLVDFVRSVFLRIGADIIGIGPLANEEDEQELLRELRLFIDGATVEWSRRDHREVLAEAQEAREAFLKRFFDAAWAERLRQVADVAAGKLQEDKLRPDLLTILARNAQDNGPDREQAIRESILFIVASTLNNAGLVTNFVDELSAWNVAHKDAPLNIEDKKVFQKAMDETLRLHPPAPALIRSPLAHAKLSSGREFQPGELVALDLVKVNRDPKAFGRDAESFNPGRTLAPMVRAYGLAFGAGAHFCLGQPMVTMSKGGLDQESVGSQYKLINALYKAGIRQDPQHPPVLVNSAQDRYDDYPVIFDRL